MIAVSTDNEQKIKITLQPMTKGTSTDGPQPAQVDGDVSYEVTEGDATVEVVDGTGGKEAYLVSGSANTVNRIRVSADADLGEGVATIEEEVIYTVTQAGAAGLGATVGAAEQK